MEEKINLSRKEARFFRLLDYSYRREVNVIKIHQHNSNLHEELKQKICENILTKNEKFVCEAIFVSGGRADVFNISTGEVFEIMISEHEESINKKKLLYPQDVKIKTIRNI